MAARVFHKLGNRVGGALSQLPSVQIDSAHARVRGKWNEMRFTFGDFTAAQTVFFLSQHNDRAALGCFVRKTGKLSSVRQFAFGHSVDGDELDGLPISEG